MSWQTKLLLNLNTIYSNTILSFNIRKQPQQLVAVLNSRINLNEEIDETNGAIQHAQQIIGPNSTIKSSTQRVTDDNFFIQAVSSAFTQYVPLVGMLNIKYSIIELNVRFRFRLLHIRFSNQAARGGPSDRRWTVNNKLRYVREMRSLFGCRPKRTSSLWATGALGGGGFEVGHFYGVWIIKFLVRVHPQILI